jgi:hypothetical protein
MFQDGIESHNALDLIHLLLQYMHSIILMIAFHSEAIDPSLLLYELKTIKDNQHFEFIIG